MLSANTTDFFLLTKESLGLKGLSGKATGLEFLVGALVSSSSLLRDAFLDLIVCSWNEKSVKVYMSCM